jgi:hypothetical protein
MSWISAGGTAALLLVLLYVPGWLGLRLLGVRGTLGVAAAPALTVGVLAVGTVALDVTGVRWSPPSVAGLLALVVVLCALLGRLRPVDRVELSPMSPGWRLAVAGGVLAGLIIQGVAIGTGMVTPDAVHQIHDAIFHLNATESVVRTGNASPFGGLDTMYGDVTGVFYPTGWHAVVALLAPTSSVVVASNLLMLSTAVVVWPLGIVALSRAVAPRAPVVAAVAPVLAASFVIFPADIHVYQGMYPYSLALAMSPAVIALLVALVRSRRNRPWTPALAAAVAGIGVIGAHPSGVGIVAAGLLPVLLEETMCAAGRSWRGRRRARAVVTAATIPALCAAGVLAIAVVPRLRAMTNFPAPEGSPWLALGRAFTTATPIGWTSTWANAVVGLLIAIGLVSALSNRRTRWFGGVWLLALTLFVVAFGPDTALRGITAPWYESGERTEAMLSTYSAVLAALGAYVVGRALARHAVPVGAAASARHALRPRGAAPWQVGVLVAGVVLVAFVASGGFRAEERRDGWTAWAFQPDRLVHPPYVTDDELTMLRSLRHTLPDDAVVVGDPFSGAALVQAVAGKVAFIPQVNPNGWDGDQRFLRDRFYEIHDRSEICDVVRDEGIGYYYDDVDNGAGWTPQSRGIADVDTSRGFELVASAETARVYRITACG